MKKIFGNKLRLKEKAKQREEHNAENAFLHGRRPTEDRFNEGRRRNGRPTMFAGYDGGQSASASPGGSGYDGALSAAVSASSSAASKPRPTAARLLGLTAEDLGESLESQSTSYYRAGSNEAISARGREHFEEENNNNEQHNAHGKTTGDEGGDDDHRATKKSSKKPSGRLSQEEIDKDTKRRLKEERRRQRDVTKSTTSGKKDSHKSSFEERLYDGSSYDANDNLNNSSNSRNFAQDEDDGDERKPRKSHHHKQKKSERRRKTDEDESRHRSKHNSRRSTEDSDQKLKERLREQRDAAKSLRASAGASAGSHNDSKNDEDYELEHRRRQRRDQDDRDKKMKESIREQRNAAKGLRTSATHAARSTNQNSNPRGVDDELEQRRQRQRNQDEKDKKLKESVRAQSRAAQSLRASSTSVPGVTSVRASGLSVVNEERQGLTSNQMSHINEEDDRLEDHYDSNNDLVSDDVPGRSFSSGLQDLGSFVKPAKGSQSGVPDYLREEEEDIPESLIGMHMAQFRATTKANANDMDDELYDEFDVDGISPNAPLAEFQERELQKNEGRRQSKRMSTTTLKIAAWQEKYTLKKAIEIAERTPEMEWLSSFYRCDPRWNIMKFFDEVAREGGEAPMDENLAASPLAGLFNKASVFTVWRPTSNEAIKNMMLGIATGKGLDIKGKSAKKGNISSYVPFIQIYEEPHKEHVRAYIKDGKTVRVFYQSRSSRNEAYEMILDIKDFMLFAAEDAMRVLSDEFADPAEQELAMKHLMYDDISLNVKFVDDYANSDNPVYGLDITERLFWETYVMMQDCSRPSGSEWDIGRGSELTFMEMNLKSIRNIPSPGEPSAVVYQKSTCSPMEPRTLLMAYEEFGRVKPVVSDFDCFLLGSRGVKYNNPIPKEQVELVEWSVKNISDVLDERAAFDSKAGWMGTWFKVLKKAALKGYYPKTPRYGNADPKSYEIIEVAVSRLQETGCVRHGAECFNWFFPQEIDDELLVISDTLPGNVKWKKVNVQQLQEILIHKIKEGFTFPINPKWVLCDPGWRRVYDALLASQKPNVQDSLNCWLPPGSGLREEIDRVSAKHPLGFEGTYEKMDGTEMRDQMEDDLERYIKVQRAWRKLRLLLFWIRFAREKRREKEEIMALRARLEGA